ncbi:hypothetical protein [Streptomyces sp. C36]|uniref:hypothetical protein n=1 Tax=Streptomyces sp. C36 TaxID=3237122 RepID=UPI0034C6323C
MRRPWLRWRRRRQPISNRERNIQRILNPPGPTFRDEVGRIVGAVEEYWCRHVTQRELYRRLDGIRLATWSALQPDRYTLEDLQRGLQRLRDAFAAEQTKPD